VGGGLAAGREKPIDGDSVNNLDGMLLLEGEFYTYDYPKTELSLTTVAFPSLNNAGRVRVEAQGQVRREIVHDFFLALTVYDSYDSEPPVADVDQNDAGVTFSLGWTF
jgi:hypothetical protein